MSIQEKSMKYAKRELTMDVWLMFTMIYTTRIKHIPRLK
jgi:hypothetical protein